MFNLSQTHAHVEIITTPLTHTYINDYLENIRAIKQEAKTLPEHISPLFHQLTFNRDVINHNTIALKLGLPFSYAMVEGGVADWDGSEINLIGSLRANCVIGDLYNHSPYFRVGHDYIPIGLHVSELMAPESIITFDHFKQTSQKKKDQKSFLIEMGAMKKSAYDRLQVSAALFPKPFIGTLVGNIKYQLAPLKQFRVVQINHCTVGGSIGVGSRQTKKEEKAFDLGLLIDIYSRVVLHNKYHLQGEYSYNNLFIDLADKYTFSPHALHIEITRYLPKIVVYSVPIASACIIIGYELGSRPIQKDQHFQNNCFAVLKISFTKHLDVILGYQRPIANQEKSPVFYRLSLSF